MLAQWQIVWLTGVSFAKLCDALYDQLTHRKGHLSYFITLGCVVHALPCIVPRTPRVATCIGTQEPEVQTRRMNIFVKDSPGITDPDRVHIQFYEKKKKIEGPACKTKERVTELFKISCKSSSSYQQIIIVPYH